MAHRKNTARNVLSTEQHVRAFMAEAPHRIGLVIFPEASAFDATAVADIFSTANGELGRTFGTTAPAYTLEVISPVPGPVRMEMGLQLTPDRVIGSDASLPALDTLLITGGCWEPVECALADAALIDWIRAAAVKAPRVASLCTGAFLLAEAGVLDGPATTHWALCDKLASRYPHLDVRADNIFTKSGKVYTSAGSTAAMDLALALVEEDLGHKIAMAVARRMVMFLRRPGGQSQFSTALAAQSAAPQALNGVPEWILTHLDADLSVEKLAARAAMSPRNFARVFAAETGFTPARYVERARIERARGLIEETRLPLASIAVKAGFEDDRQMRRAFLRWLKVKPSDYLARFRGGADGNAYVDAIVHTRDGSTPGGRGSSFRV